MKKIVCRKSTRKSLLEYFKVSPSTISNALNFKSFGQKHSEIRVYAVNKLNALYIEL